MMSCMNIDLIKLWCIFALHVDHNHHYHFSIWFTGFMRGESWSTHEKNDMYKSTIFIMGLLSWWIRFNIDKPMDVSQVNLHSLKPHSFGNEYHTIADGLNNILFWVETIKDKFAPNFPVNFDEKGKTPGLLLCLTRGIWGSGKVVLFDSGFCVLQGIIDLIK